MKDYSKVKYVKPSVDGLDITKGKVYEVDIFFSKSLFSIKDDSGDFIVVSINEDPKPSKIHPIPHRYNWIPCYENGKEIELCEL